MSRETRARKEKRNADVKADRRKQAKAILTKLGLWEELKESNLADRILSAHYPRAEVVVGRDEEPTIEKSEILGELQKKLNELTFDCPLLGNGIKVQDYFSSIKPLMDLIDSAVSDNARLHDFLVEAKQRIKPLATAEIAAKGMLLLLQAFEDVLIRFGRIDRCLFYVELEQGRNSKDKWFVRFALRIAPCEFRTVDPSSGSEKKPRPAFRCGQPFGLNGIEWVEWPASLMVQTESHKSFPVFVQSHALDNLYKKEARALFIEEGEWLVHDYLWQSLRQPKLHPLAGHSRKYLVEYWLNAHKLGYLVAHRLDDVVLIESFLFLTMTGTPEGNLLHEKLRITRTDREHLELDRIQTFLVTDVQFDSKLVELLTECGCGHLFRILIEPLRERLIPGHAEAIRKYLGLND